MHATPLASVVEHIRQEASHYGVELAESELVGLMPSRAALDAASVQLGLPRLTASQVIELALASMLPDAE
jgi:glutamate formiminotransferase